MSDVDTASIRNGGNAADSARSCPMTAREITNRYFLDARSKLLDLAAFLDRLDRASDGADSAGDFRIDALRDAMGELMSKQPGRAKRIQQLWSDPTTEPIVKLVDKGATGAWPGRAAGPR